MTGGTTGTKPEPKRTRQRAAPPPAPAPVTVQPVLLWNNWTLRRAGLKGFRVEASFDGEALCLAGRRRGTLGVPATAIERMLVGYERMRFDCTWRTIIWSPLTRRGLVLATSKRSDPGFVRLVEAIAGAVAGAGAGRMDRIKTGQRMVDALVMPFFAVGIFGLMIYGLWFEPEYSTPRTPELATARLWITGLGTFMLFLAFWEFIRVTRPRRIGELSDLHDYLPGW